MKHKEKPDRRYEKPSYDPDWTDSRRAPGGQSKLQGRLNDGFQMMFYGDEDPNDMSDEELRDRHLRREVDAIHEKRHT